MLSKKTTLVCLIFVVFSGIIALNISNKEQTQPISQTQIEVDEK